MNKTEALEFIASQNFDGADDRAIAIMATMLVHKAKEALAQSEQEPLEYWNAVEGWVKIDEVRQHFETVSCGTIYKTAGEGRVPLYTAPPKRQPLTDQRINEIYQEATCQSLRPQDYKLARQFARSIEAAHGIKETQ